MTPGKASVKYILILMFINWVLADCLSQYKYKYIIFMRIYASIIIPQSLFFCFISCKNYLGFLKDMVNCCQICVILNIENYYFYPTE